METRGGDVGGRRRERRGIEGDTRDVRAGVSEALTRGFISARRFGPQELEQLAVPVARVLDVGVCADGAAAAEAGDGFVDHGADGAVFVGADDARAARAVEEDACVDEV